MEEELPVDVADERLEVRLDDPAAGERRRREFGEVELLGVRARVLDRGERLALLVGVLLAQAFLQLAVLSVEPCAPLVVEQVRHHADDP